jgi:hypothetical protein
MTSALTMEALSLLPASWFHLPTSFTQVINGHTYTVRVEYLPDTEGRCTKAALALLNLRPSAPAQSTCPETPPPS